MTGEGSMENILFDEALKRIQSILNIIGLPIGYRSHNKGFWVKLRNIWWILFNILWLGSDILGELTFFMNGLFGKTSGKSFTELTQLTPCLSLCILSVLQAYYFIKHGEQIFELITVIRNLNLLPGNRSDKDETFLKSRIKFLYLAINGLTVVKVTLIIAFGLSPFIVMLNTYRATGTVKLIAPFVVSYPFKTDKPKPWTILYIHEMWSAVIAVILYLVPYYLCYTCSTFIIFQFYCLKNDLENIIPHNEILRVYQINEEFSNELIEIIERHKEIIRCVDLMEFVYSETTLCNVVLSSFLICLTGFNVVVIHDLAVTVPFLEFLLMGLIQIYLICYYGDMIADYSTKIGDAIYFSQWYRVEVPIVKDMFMISTRAQKPCKLTALRFSDVNFKTLARILSTSWSYFALLTSIYRK